MAKKEIIIQQLLIIILKELVERGFYQLIESLLDTDLYKFTMSQFAYIYDRHTKVKFEFINRTKQIRLAEQINPYRLQTELMNIQGTHFTESDIEYLKSLNLFCDSYLNELRSFSLPNISVNINKETGQLEISTEGEWWKVTFWETFVLSIISELYNSNQQPLKYKAHADGTYNLIKKMDTLQSMKLNGYIPEIVDFGTRRRFSHDWQGFVLTILQRDMPNILAGTSNVYMARELGLKPIGTYAHEMEMVYASGCSIREEYFYQHQDLMRKWFLLYGEKLSIALADTYGSMFFWESTPKDFLQKWKGVRQDSGDPFHFVDDAIEAYQTYDIDPLEKTIIFSDSLNVELIRVLKKYCKGKINCSFGWGTDLMNDCGVPALSLVMKATEANGIGLVKLSDNPAKAIGRETNIRAAQDIIGYVPGVYEELRS